MTNDFRGKTAFITGGASGIGLAMAHAFGHAGMNVVVADIDEAAAREAVDQLASAQIQSLPVYCDVAQRESIREASRETIARFGKVHIVCNNAGVAVGGQAGTLSSDDWDWIIDVNLKGVIYGFETFVPLIHGHGEGGHIVNTASIAGLISAPGLEPYSATKYAVVALSEGWVQQLAPLNIGLSVLCPGFVRTRIHQSDRNRQAQYRSATVNSGGQSDADLSPLTQAIETGIHPDIVGRRVLEAMRDGDFYIFTDPRYRDIVAMRFAGINAGFDAASKSPALASVKDWAPITLLAR